MVLVRVSLNCKDSQYFIVVQVHNNNEKEMIIILLLPFDSKISSSLGVAA
jgi:hypothetical protein